MATPSAGGPSGLRWFAVSLALALLALIGLGVSAEGRDEFESRVVDNDWRRSEDPSGGSDGTSGGGSSSGSGSGYRPGSGEGPGTVSGPGGDGTPVDVEIRTPDGSVGIDLQGDGTCLAHTSGEPGSEPLHLRPDPAGGTDELLVTGDGGLEPVPADQLRPDGLVLRPVDGGVDLVQPDGTVIQLRPGPDGRGVEATEVSPEGSVRTLEADRNGEIPIDEDTTLVTGRPGLGMWERDTPWRWIFIAIASIVAASLALAGFLYLTKPDHPFGPDFVGPAGVPADRFEEFLAMLADDDDHSRAIRLAFLAAERGIGGLPTRGETETPFEWSDRVAASRPDVADPLSDLCTLFATARFAPERPTAADRDRAISCLRRLHQHHHQVMTATTTTGRTSADRPGPVGAGPR
jgi:hypothetical protein